VLEILPVAADLLAEVRQQSEPRALVLHTCRFGPHSKGDDTRDPTEIARVRLERDPLQIHGARLDPAARRRIEAKVEAEVNQAFEQAQQDPFPTLENIHA
jgi:TPP-dependent pyruvate/acetoin dehydrogenase alpha subunit